MNFPGSGRTNYIFGSTQDKIVYHIQLFYVIQVRIERLLETLCLCFQNIYIFSEMLCEQKTNQTCSTDRVSESEELHLAFSSIPPKTSPKIGLKRIFWSQIFIRTFDGIKFSYTNIFGYSFVSNLFV